jgi:hypothetical protein
MTAVQDDVSMTRVLDAEGKVVGNMPEFARKAGELLKL